MQTTVDRPGIEVVPNGSLLSTSIPILIPDQIYMRVHADAAAAAAPTAERQPAQRLEAPRQDMSRYSACSPHMVADEIRVGRDSSRGDGAGRSHCSWLPEVAAPVLSRSVVGRCRSRVVREAANGRGKKKKKRRVSRPRAGIVSVERRMLQGLLLRIVKKSS